MFIGHIHNCKYTIQYNTHYNTSSLWSYLALQMNRTMVMNRPQMDIQIPMKMKVRPNHLRSIAISIIPEGKGEGGHVSNNALICCLFKGGY